MSLIHTVFGSVPPNCQTKGKLPIATAIAKGKLPIATAIAKRKLPIATAKPNENCQCYCHCQES